MTRRCPGYRAAKYGEQRTLMFKNGRRVMRLARFAGRQLCQTASMFTSSLVHTYARCVQRTYGYMLERNHRHDCISRRQRSKKREEKRQAIEGEGERERKSLSQVYVLRMYTQLLGPTVSTIDVGLLPGALGKVVVTCTRYAQGKFYPNRYRIKSFRLGALSDAV